MKIEEMNLDEINIRMAEIQNEVTSEDADLNALEEEVRSLSERKEAIQEMVEEERKVQEEVIRTSDVKETFGKDGINTMTDMEIRNTKEYINAYAEYVKSGDDKQCRSLLTENVSGTVAVPDFVYEIIKHAWETDDIMSRVRKSYVRGNLKVQFEASATDAVKHTEGAAAVAEETLGLGIVTAIPASYKKWISVSDEALDMGGEAFLRYIYEEISRKIAQAVGNDLITKIKACPTTSSSTKPAVALVNKAVAVGTVAAALAQLTAEATNPVIIMNRQTWADFKAAQYAANYPIDPFENLPVIFNNSLPSYSAASTNACYAIVGDLANGALANFPNGEEITMKIDDLSKFESDLVRILGREYVAVEPIAPLHFVQLTKPSAE